MIKVRVDRNLDVFDVFSNMPSGKKIILEITATITPIETHFIQSNILSFSFNFDEKTTPKALHKKVANEDTIIANTIRYSFIMFVSKKNKTYCT